MKILNFIIIKLSICLIIGIVIGYYSYFEIHSYIFLCIGFLIAYGVFLKFLKQKYKYTSWSGALIFTSAICIGITTVNIHKQSHFKGHYSQLYVANKTISLQLRINAVLKPNDYYTKYFADVIKIDNQKVQGKILLNVYKDSLYTPLKVDDIIYTTSQFKPIKPPLNPHQFNYKDYLLKKHVHHQLFTTKNNMIHINSKKHTAKGFAALIREKINTNLKKFNLSKDEVAIINAILLGQRQDISKEIYNNYSQAGAIHILAVSGLHIGIILMLLNRLLKPIEYLKKGHVIKIIIIILLLWCFAVVAGLSASVIRAVTMFTIIGVSINLKRPTNIINTLFISIFVILLFNPMFIFDIGFQLSYLAVFAIVIIVPLIDKLWIPKNKLVLFLWKIITVTIAAQVGVLPLSLFYFHQFPGLFFLSNIVVIPFLGLILGLGILNVVLLLCNALPNFLAELYGKIISLMNHFIQWVASHDVFIIKDISFNIYHVLFSYVIISCLLIIIKKRHFLNILFTLLSVIFLQFYLIFNKQNQDSAFIIFHKNKHSVIGLKNGDEIDIHTDLQIEDLKTESLIQNYCIGDHIKNLRKDNLRSIYILPKTKVLVIDSQSIFNVKSIKPNYILLRNSPKINLNRLIDSLKPELIICDGSNYRSYQERWLNTCKTKKIPFYQTSKKGAFILNY